MDMMSWLNGLTPVETATPVTKKATLPMPETVDIRVYMNDDVKIGLPLVTRFDLGFKPKPPGSCTN